MKKDYSISVILPVFLKNPSPKEVLQFERCILSVMNQSYPEEMELIIIDNGPFDVKSLHLSFSQIGIKIIKTASLGLVNALNTGLKIARYEWIARIDADDFWADGKILNQVNLLKSDGDTTIVATGMSIFDENGKFLQKHIRKNGWDEIIRFSADIGCPFPHGSVLARREIFDLLGGYSHNKDVEHCEDYALWSIWIRFFKPAMLEDSYYNYTVSSQQISQVFNSEQSVASSRVNQNIKQLELGDKLPKLLLNLSAIFRLSLTEVGMVCFLLWKYRLRNIIIPREALRDIKALLPDRVVVLDSKRNTGISFESLDQHPQMFKDLVGSEITISIE